MISRLIAAGVLALTAATAQTYAYRAWFPDGAGVDIQIETTGSTAQTELSGGGGISAGHKYTSDDYLFRYVQDGQGKTIFGYVLEANKAREPNAVTIRIKNAAHAGDPTVSGMREFAAVKYGQEVKIEILANPTTGERVYDVLRPVEAPSPSPGYHTIGNVDIPKLVVNGQTMAVKGAWENDKLPRLYIPGRGAYYLSWASRPKYRLAGYIERGRLIFLMDSEYVEMSFLGNVLGDKEGGPVWIYRDPDFVPANHGGATCSLDSYR
jgi:hypothetical protein